MSPFQLTVLALIQGITEFLPVSSSAHLVLAPHIAGWADQGALIDIMAHVGTLAALIVYFRADLVLAAGGGLDLLRRRATPGAHLALLLIVATPPALIAGGVLYLGGWVDYLRDPVVLAWMNLIFAVPLFLADRYAPRVKTTENLSLRGALAVGLAQMLALIPGVSRSGITMTAGRALGLTRVEAARFSMLMAIPILLAFGAAAGLELADSDANAAQSASMADGLLVAGLSFLAGLAAIAVLMRLVERVGFLPFVVYRLALGVLLIAIFGWRIGG